MKRAIFLSLAFSALGLIFAAGGLRLSPYLARSLGFAPFRQTIVSGDGAAPALVELIASAKASVVIAAESIDNRSVLEALQAAAARKVQIAVVLSGAAPINQEPIAGARAWLTERRIPVFVSPVPIRGAILVVDQIRGATLASPILASAALARANVPIFAFEHSPTAATYFSLIRSWLPT